MGANNVCKPDASAHPSRVLVHAYRRSGFQDARPASPTKVLRVCLQLRRNGRLASRSPFIAPGRIDGLDHIEKSAGTQVVRGKSALQNGRLEGGSRGSLPGRDDAQLLHQVPRRSEQGERADRARPQQPRHHAERCDDTARSVPLRQRIHDRVARILRRARRYPNRRKTRRSSKNCSVAAIRSSRA